MMSDMSAVCVISEHMLFMGSSKFPDENEVRSRGYDEISFWKVSLAGYWLAHFTTMLTCHLVTMSFLRARLDGAVR